ncbi:glycosyltransferase family 2 protein [Dactylosporangium sp. AC04546]|uniref:glycosyltransferase family 2 protein n=1 Tax=Dactylosporangium sp. AC04546 TaxID=2862460 RepID=UPI001EDE93B0|nr:glycosyltransferase family 2 protein [Dactylosporangium sp. AC04546]WVK85868.1 glycosyltransferase family 2 protein [Dactylosporangium sp. AC04546]
MLDIMLPHYGDLRLLKLAVDSVLAQTDDRWRLTVFDDNPAGRHEEVPAFFAALDDPRVRYHRNPENLGITRNFQQCIDQATEPFMVIMGCDDVMLPGYVARVHQLVEAHPDAVLVQPGVEVIDGGGAVVKTLVDSTKRRVYAPKFTGTLVMTGEELAVSLLRGNWLYFPSLAWRTSEMQAVGFDASLSVIQDLALILNLVVRGGSLVADDTLCFQYRRHNDSLSASSAVTGNRFSEARNFFLGAAARMEAHGWPRAAKAARWHLSSRIHALTMLPAAAKQRSGSSVRVLTRYAFGPPRQTSR